MMEILKRNLLCNLLVILSLFGHSQNVAFKISPFITGITSIKDGLIEAGPEFNWEKVESGKSITLRPTIRIPLTSKTDNVLQIDRYSSTWKGVLCFQYTKDNTLSTGKIERHTWSGQIEYGCSGFKYYPTGDKNNEQKNVESSYAVELKYIGFLTKGESGAKQFSPQFRLRYSYDWKASDPVGVVNPPTSTGLFTTTNLIVSPPSAKPVFSPAFSLQIYAGKGSLSYSPTIYYDFAGKQGSTNPFNNVNRLRLESWIFFYPMVNGNPNIKLGITPFLSIRTYGSDNYNNIEYGGIITMKFGTTFLQFL